MNNKTFIFFIKIVIIANKNMIVVVIMRIKNFFKKKLFK